MSEFTREQDNGKLLFARWNRGTVSRMLWRSASELLVTAANGQFSYDMSRLIESRDNNTGLQLSFENSEFTLVDGHTGTLVSIVQEPETMLAVRYVLSPDQSLLVTYEGPKISLWETKSGKRLPAIVVAGNVVSITFSPDSRRLLIEFGSVDSINLAIWEAASNKIIWREEENLIDYVSNVAFSPDASRVALCGKRIRKLAYQTALTGDPTLWVVDIDKGTSKLMKSPEGFSFSPFNTDRMQFLNNNALLLVGESSKVAIVDVTTGEVDRIIEVQGNVHEMALSPDDTLLATTNGWTVEIRKLADNKQIVSFNGYASSVSSLDFSTDNTRLLSVIADRLQVLDTETLKLAFDRQVKGQGAVFGADAQMVILSKDGRTTLWDAKSDRVAWTRPGNLKFYSADRKKLLVVEDVKSGENTTSTARTLDGVTGDVLAEFDVSGACGMTAARDLSVLAIARIDKTVKAFINLVDPSTGKELAKLGAGTECPGMDFSPGSKLIASEGEGLATVWDVSSGKKVVDIRPRHASISLFGLVTRETGSPHFVTDAILATTGGDWGKNEVFTWAVPSGKNLGKFTNNRTHLGFSSDGMLEYENALGTILVTDAFTGEIKDLLGGHRLSVSDLVLSSDGKMMLTGSYDGTVIFRRIGR
jgi:WD40 repeat protein